MPPVKDIQIKDFDYQLPDDRIAKFPAEPRDHSRLLVYRQGEILDDHFYRLADHLAAGTLMVFNNTKVIRARLHFRRPTGALIEVLLLEPCQPATYEQALQSTGNCRWHCLVGNLKKWHDEPLSQTVSIGSATVTLTVKKINHAGPVKIENPENPANPVEKEAANLQLKNSNPQPPTNSNEIDFSWSDPRLTFADIIGAVGEMPLPPYLNRTAQASDLTSYQTVYSKTEGSVAAPTAGLHFTPQVLSSLQQHGIQREELTLHVGAGTFRPVKSPTIAGHEMHAEHISVSRSTLQRLLDHHCRCLAVGTTSVRTLESLYYMGAKAAQRPDISEQEMGVGQWEPYAPDAPAIPPEQAVAALISWMDARATAHLTATTRIIIVPGYRYKFTRALLTNFHQPQSTLLLLVAALVGPQWRTIYDHALAHDYRFLSYGDCCLLMPNLSGDSRS